LRQPFAVIVQKLQEDAQTLHADDALAYATRVRARQQVRLRYALSAHALSLFPL
jgi:hypothetical protein